MSSSDTSSLLKAVRGLDKELREVSEYAQNEDLADGARAARASLLNHLDAWGVRHLLEQ